MFGAIAPSYDLNNRLHSFGRDQAWRRAAVQAAALKAGDRVLDVACGTGDLTIAFAKKLASLGGRMEAGQVIGGDFTPAMLDLAKVKSRSIRPVRGMHADACKLNELIAWQQQDATSLGVESETVDVVSIAFGLRNVGDGTAALGEFFRVLKPGGRLVILEFSEPANPLLRWGNRFYCHQVMPHTATWISRDQSGAYKYLPKSVESFWSRQQTEQAMAKAGFGHVHHKALTFGVAVAYVGRKP